MATDAEVARTQAVVDQGWKHLEERLDMISDAIERGHEPIVMKCLLMCHGEILFRRGMRERMDGAE